MMRSLSEIKWGAVIAAGYELSLSLLVKCVEAVDEPAMGCPNAVSLIISSGLPFLMLNFDSPTPLCITVASALANFLTAKIPEEEGDVGDNPINHLSAVSNFSTSILRGCRKMMCRITLYLFSQRRLSFSGMRRNLISFFSYVRNEIKIGFLVRADQVKADRPYCGRFYAERQK
uniref:Uncharacterized protein n=1 Tax=Parascaris equorum TaxID=6256 RepID=A0A914RFC5_PAREQ